MADRRRCLGLLGGFGDGRLNGTMPNVVGPTLVAMATTFGLTRRSSRLPACPSVCLSVTLLQIASSFFVSQWNRAILCRQFSMWHSTKRCSNANNLLPKICNCTKSPISRLVWQIDWRCLSLPGGFRGWPIQWNHAKCCGVTLVATATKFGLGADNQWPTGLSLVVAHFPKIP